MLSANHDFAFGKISHPVADSNRRLKDYFENWRRCAVILKEKSKEILEDTDVRVYVFGSVVRGECHAYLSDIDVAVVSERLPKEGSARGRVLGEMSRALGTGLRDPSGIPGALGSLVHEVYRQV